MAEAEAAKLRVAIIGSGWGVRVQVPAFREAGLEVVALWARTEEKAAAIAEEHGIPLVSTDYDAVIGSSAQLISIVTPPETHLPLMRKTLEAGKHCLCEKPTALNEKEAKEMVELAAAHPELITVFDHELRFGAIFKKMREIVSSGRLGELQFVQTRFVRSWRLNKSKPWTWWSDKTVGGGTLGAIGSHIYDMVQYTTGLRAVTLSGRLVTAVKTRLEGEEAKEVTSDDAFYALAQLEGGVEAVLVADMASPEPGSSCFTFTGSDASMFVDLSKGITVRSLDSEDVEEMEVEGHDPKSNSFQAASRLIAEALAQAILHGDDSALSVASKPEHAYNTQLFIDAVHASHAAGGATVKLEDMASE